MDGLSSSAVLMGRDPVPPDGHLASKEEAEDHKGKLGPSGRRHMEAVTGLETEMKAISDQHFGVPRGKKQLPVSEGEALV